MGFACHPSFSFLLPSLSLSPTLTLTFLAPPHCICPLPLPIPFSLLLKLARNASHGGDPDHLAATHPSTHLRHIHQEDCVALHSATSTGCRGVVQLQGMVPLALGMLLSVFFSLPPPLQVGCLGPCRSHAQLLHRSPSVIIIIVARDHPELHHLVWELWHASLSNPTK